MPTGWLLTTTKTRFSSRSPYAQADLLDDDVARRLHREKTPSPGYVFDFARIWKPKPKIVFSKTLDKVEWNSRLVKGDVAAEVEKLKREPGDYLTVGGANQAATLIDLGLIDEIRLIVHPVVLGRGTPFFPPVPNTINLRLLETQTFGSGVVYLRYEVTR